MTECGVKIFIAFVLMLYAQSLGYGHEGTDTVTLFMDPERNE